MNLLERVIATLAPVAAVRRAAARMALRGYDGAGVGRRTKGWNTPSLGPVSEIRAARVMLRNRARDLVRNNAWGRRAVDILVASEIGTGIRPRPAGDSPSLNRKISKLWDAWAAECDHDGLLDFYGLQALAGRTRAESGEALVMMVDEGSSSSRAVPLRLQVLEPDWLADFVQVPMLQSDAESEGILFNEDGSRKGYRLWNRNPNENYAWAVAATNARVVPAADMVHLFARERPGQIRGVPDLAAVIRPLRDLDDYTDAALMLAKVQSILGVFIEQQGGPSGGPMGAPSTDDGGRLETLAPGMISYLRPGEKPTFLAPQGGGPFAEYTRLFLHMIAAGFGITFHQLTGDLRDANYSSMRAGSLEFRRRIEQRQHLLLIPSLCRPIWQRFIRNAILAGKLPARAAEVPVVWTPPRFDMVDPIKDTQALIQQVRAGFMTQAEAIAEMGYDPATQVEQIAAFNQLLDEAGVVLDTDPRRILAARTKDATSPAPAADPAAATDAPATDDPATAQE